MTEEIQPLVLIVEDEPDIASVLVAYFERDGFRTITARDGEMALTHLSMLKPDIVILDVQLPKKPLEIVARARAILRRGRGAKTSILRVASIEVDQESHSAAIVSGDKRKALDLTLTEFRILSHMIRAPRRVFSRLELLDACLSDSDAVERTVDSHISHLRKKMSRAGAPDYFAGVRGVGYRLVSE